MERKSNIISIIVSVYNEEAVIKQFYFELIKILNSLNYDYELIFINDGSTDSSIDLLKEIINDNNKTICVNFSRNFGHEAAMSAGIDLAKGNAIICMDADLQHPPEKILDMIKKYEEGYEIVNMVRTDRKDHNFIMKLFSKAFYKLLSIISNIHFNSNATDFFLISKKIAEILKNDFREKTRFLRGFIQVIGFKRTSVNFAAPKRFAGKSKYSFFKLSILSFSAIATFSNIPLILGIIVGGIFGLFSILVGIYTLIMKFSGEVISGYTTKIGRASCRERV